MLNTHKYNSGIIGNGSYIAHIQTNGSVPWLCWPNFDSSPIFGQYLGESLGEYSITVDSEVLSTKQFYLENTNILQTEITTTTGSFAIIDFAPRYYENGKLMCNKNFYRKISPIDGEVKLSIKIKPAYQYGKETPKEIIYSDSIQFQFVRFNLFLLANISLNRLSTCSSFILNQTIYLGLFEEKPGSRVLGHLIDSEFVKTKLYWQNWVKHCTIPNFAQSEQIRSALCLKLHQFQDTGAIIAASTTSLPEAPGSGRNWDYRFCWLRDGFYTLFALTNLGQFEELERYSHYISNLTPTPEGRFQPLYSIFGEPLLTETILDLDGYLGNLPVRIGNDAYTHKQNDAYGQILLSLLPLYLDERIPEKNRFHNLNQLNSILNQIEKTMDEPDAGLWEFRNFSQKHCYTFLFHWVGSRATREIAKKLGDKNLENRSTNLMELAASNIELCYDDSLGCYTQAQGKQDLDASLLQLITLGYLDPNSKKAQTHISAIETKLKTEDGLMYRYLHSDDFGKPETTFLVCTFWYIEALACMDRLVEAEELFKKVCGFSNHLGLFSEDVDSGTKSQWGNFPQTYSHVGLVNAAHKISQKKSKSLFW